MSNEPKFTIGIPTYNRPDTLRRSIESALDQTYPNVEVLVSDDASPDDTAEMVRSFGDRVRYHRNPQNIRAWPNFSQLTELATGQYFSWLQDDDVLMPDFAARAVRALTMADDVTLYCAFVYDTPSTTTLVRPPIYGPPIALDWKRGEVRLVGGMSLIPLLYFASLATPPAIAAPTAVWRRAVAHTRAESDCALYNERIVTARAAMEGRVAADPWAGAFFMKHDGQTHVQIRNNSPSEYTRQWSIMADVLGTLLESAPEGWQADAAALFEEVAVSDRLRWLEWESPQASAWESARPPAGAVRRLMLDTLPPDQRANLRDDAGFGAAAADANRLKWAVRQTTPPALWGLLRLLKRQVASTKSR